MKFYFTIFYSLFYSLSIIFIIPKKIKKGGDGDRDERPMLMHGATY